MADTNIHNISPDVQVIFNPADAPDKAVCFVLSLRLKFQF